MKSNILFFIELIVSFLPFILFAFLNSKSNVKKENRSRQYAMPVAAVLYSAVLLIFLNQLSALFLNLFLKLAAAVTEPMGDEKVSSFLSSLSGTVNYFTAGLLAVGFMYFITILLLICSSNALF